MKYNIEIASENALIVYFGQEQNTTTPAIANSIQELRAQLQILVGNTLIDLIPSYASLLVVFDPFQVDHLAVKRMLDTNLVNLQSSAKGTSRLIELPVYYGEEVGLDLDRIADNSGLSPEQVVAMHQELEYRVYAIGFAPGFGYLGEVDKRIATPRLTTPRAHVAKGAVGIADRQTAIYPAPSPGGWNIIGRCPVPMFTPNQQPPMPIDVGDRVKFRAIDKSEYLALGGEL